MCCLIILCKAFHEPAVLSCAFHKTLLYIKYTKLLFLDAIHSLPSYDYNAPAPAVANYYLSVG